MSKEFKGNIAFWVTSSLLLWDPKKSPSMRNNLREAAKRINDAQENVAEVLDLSGLELQDLPECLQEIGSLKEINLQSNKFKTLPEVISRMSNIERIFIGDRNDSLSPNLSPISNHNSIQVIETDEKGRSWSSFLEKSSLNITPPSGRPLRVRPTTAANSRQENQQSPNITFQMRGTQDMGRVYWRDSDPNVPDPSRKLNFNNMVQEQEVREEIKEEPIKKLPNKTRPKTAIGTRRIEPTPSGDVWKEPNQSTAKPHEEILTRTHVARKTPNRGKVGQPIGLAHGDVPVQQLVDNSSKSTSR
jgi:hypothetical protein